MGTAGRGKAYTARAVKILSTKDGKGVEGGEPERRTCHQEPHIKEVINRKTRASAKRK